MCLGCCFDCRLVTLTVGRGRAPIDRNLLPALPGLDQTFETAVSRPIGQMDPSALVDILVDVRIRQERRDKKREAYEEKRNSLGQSRTNPYLISAQ